MKASSRFRMGRQRTATVGWFPFSKVICKTSLPEAKKERDAKWPDSPWVFNRQGEQNRKATGRHSGTRWILVSLRISNCY
jgi:hypothetical protein